MFDYHTYIHINQFNLVRLLGVDPDFSQSSEEVDNEEKLIMIWNSGIDGFFRAEAVAERMAIIFPCSLHLASTKSTTALFKSYMLKLDKFRNCPSEEQNHNACVMTF